MITVYTITYNEEIILPFFIDSYRRNFPDCKIVIYDNMSTDETVKIAESHGCEVVTFDTNGKFSDIKHMEIKNNCWKNSETDWVVVCDCDEIVEVNQKNLRDEEVLGVNFLRFEGYTMINSNVEFIDLEKLNTGYRDIQYDKPYIFNRKFVLESNYTSGAHECNPIFKPGSKIYYSGNAYRCFHYKLLSLNYVINRHKLYYARLSDENLKNGWGVVGPAVVNYSSSRDKIIENYYAHLNYAETLFT